MSFPLPNNSHDLTGRVAFVTGASSGLGWRFAQVLASAGAKVAVAARRIDRLNELVESIKSAGGEAFAVEIDLRDADAITCAVEKAEAALGTITILVNNAGIPDAKPAVKMQLSLIDDVIDINFRAPFLVSCEVARRMIEANLPGNIVNLSSVAAYSYSAKAASTLYAASKSGVLRMTETLAMEWAHYNINVNAIAPGLFMSEMSAGMIERIGDAAYANTPRKRIGDAPQLDSTLLYLVSPASEFVTGVCIRVDDAQYPH